MQKCYYFYRFLYLIIIFQMDNLNLTMEHFKTALTSPQAQDSIIFYGWIEILTYTLLQKQFFNSVVFQTPSIFPSHNVYLLLLIGIPSLSDFLTSQLSILIDPASYNYYKPVNALLIPLSAVLTGIGIYQLFQGISVLQLHTEFWEIGLLVPAIAMAGPYMLTALLGSTGLAVVPYREIDKKQQRVTKWDFI